MPTEQEWIKRIEERAGKSGPDKGATAADMQLVDDALGEHPRSATLWCLRGDLIQLLDEDLERFPLEEALRSYERGLACDPIAPGVLEAIGYYYDAVQDEPAKAESYFRRAVEGGGGARSWAGLARVLAELGKSIEALALLDPASCPHANDSVVTEVRAEISDGMWGPNPHAG